MTYHGWRDDAEVRAFYEHTSERGMRIAVSGSRGGSLKTVKRPVVSTILAARAPTVHFDRGRGSSRRAPAFQFQGMTSTTSSIS